MGAHSELLNILESLCYVTLKILARYDELGLLKPCFGITSSHVKKDGKISVTAFLHLYKSLWQ